MNIWQSFKNIFFSVQSNQNNRIPNTNEDSNIKNIVFPDTYREVNIFHTIPPRTNLISGSQFGQSILNIAASQQRDDLIYQQCVVGNVPDWMRDFKPIHVTDGTNSLTYFVSPDVLSIGNNTDFLRVSMEGYTARKITDLFNCCIPTSTMSDQIWNSADLKLTPHSMGGSPIMSNTKVLIDHNTIIEQQRNGRNFNIITGHKKDIIVHHKLLEYKNNICIYGWHYPNGVPIQQAQYTAHNISYQDYSHSLRLISKKAILNQQSVDLYDILNDVKYAHLISNEGSFNATQIYKLT